MRKEAILRMLEQAQNDYESALSIMETMESLSSSDRAKMEALQAGRVLGTVRNILKQEGKEN